MSPHTQMIIDIITAELGHEVGIFVFGSRARDDFKEFSDFDVGLYQSKEIAAKSLHKIRELLLESDIPFTVDLVDFATAGEEFKKLATENIQVWNNPSLIKSLMKSIKN